MQPYRPEPQTASPPSKGTSEKTPQGQTPAQGMSVWSSIFCCPGCQQTGTLVMAAVGQGVEGLQCSRCGTRVAQRGGIPDFAPSVTPDEGRQHWKQVVMDSPVFARFYETAGWRPFHAYVASHGSLEQEIDDVLSLASDVPVQVAVDLACGTGLYAREIARRHPNATVVGIDISPGMLSRAQKLARDEGLSNLHFSRGDIHHLPFADASVDQLNCCAALHLFPDLPSIWREIRRVLKPGGVLTAMTVFQRPLGPYSFQAFLQRFLTFKFFEPAQLAADLEAAGLTQFKMTQRHSALMFRVVAG